MNANRVGRALLPWVIGGLILGLVQVLAVGVNKPLGVSTQFVVAEGVAAHAVAPEMAAGHELLSKDKYQSFGYGSYLDLGLILGAAVAALALGRWKLRRTSPTWWIENHGHSLGKRFAFAFVGGFFILLGSRIAGGCTSGMFASGWAQLSLSVVPFTIALFGAGMLAARLVYPRVPQIEG